MEEKEEDEPPGGTPFFRAGNLERTLHLKKLFIKFEGAGATGTQKDRISKLHALRARRKGFHTVSLATCGNYGASMSYFAGMYGLKSVIGVPSYYANERNAEIRAYGAQVMEINAKYEDVVEYMRERATDENWYDSSPGSKNSDVDLEGYEGIAYEIVSQLGHAPSHVSVPLGNGTTMAGIFSGFEKLYLRGAISRLPRFIGSSTPNGNPIVASWKKRARTVVDLDPHMIRETRASEPLVAYRSYDGQKALNAIYRSKGVAEYVTDDEMYRYSRMIENLEMLSVLPASAASLAAVDKLMSRKGDSREIVVVLTGRSGIWTTQ